jgi:hypothetical protein
VEASLDRSTRNLYRDGFERISIRKDLLTPWESLIDINAMAVEVITVSDLMTDIHYHEDAYAVITILGNWEGIKEPQGAIFYFGDKIPFRAVSGITLQVSPETIHGFGCPEGASPLVFLSVQSLRIEKDFHVVE